MFIAKTVNGRESIRKSLSISWAIPFTYEVRGISKDKSQWPCSGNLLIAKETHHSKDACWHLNRRVQLKLSDIAVEINAEARG